MDGDVGFGSAHRQCRPPRRHGRRPAAGASQGPPAFSPAPCKSGENRVNYRFRPEIWPSHHRYTSRFSTRTNRGAFSSIRGPIRSIRGIAGEGIRRRSIGFEPACCGCSYFYIDNNGADLISGRNCLRKPPIDTPPVAGGASEGVGEADRLAEHRTIRYQNSATMAANVLRQSA